MQHAKMIDLMADAKDAGLNHTSWVIDQLSEAFDYWLDSKELGEITEEERETLESSFFAGFAKSLPKAE
jgi:hypothetical protein